MRTEKHNQGPDLEKLKERRRLERAEFDALSDECKLFFIIDYSRQYAGWTNYIDFEDDFYRAIKTTDTGVFIAARAEFYNWSLDL